MPKKDINKEDIIQELRIVELPELSLSEQVGSLNFLISDENKDYKICLDNLHQLIYNQLKNELLPIGSLIDWIGYQNTIPQEFILCDGFTINKTDYPTFFDKLGLKEDTYTLPDLTKQFVRYSNNDTDLLKTKTDTMRKIKGYFAGITYLSRGSGAFLGNYQVDDKLALGSTLTSWKNTSVNFDSSLGIQGQEGSLSPNVGEETAPQLFIYTN